MGACHAVNEPVDAEELCASASIAAVAGDDVVPIERSTQGSFFRIGGKEDGGVMAGGTNVVETVCTGDSVIHCTNDLASPSMLWRHCDQLRIPRSKQQDGSPKIKEMSKTKHACKCRTLHIAKPQ